MQQKENKGTAGLNFEQSEFLHTKSKCLGCQDTYNAIPCSMLKQEYFMSQFSQILPFVGGNNHIVCNR